MPTESAATIMVPGSTSLSGSTSASDLAGIGSSQPGKPGSARIVPTLEASGMGAAGSSTLGPPVFRDNSKDVVFGIVRVFSSERF